MDQPGVGNSDGERGSKGVSSLRGLMGRRPPHLCAQPLVFCALHRLQNETAAHEVLESIQSYFKSQPFDFRGAQIISGQEEGVYGWITANYIMGNFLEVCGKKCMVSNLTIYLVPVGDSRGRGPCSGGSTWGQQPRKGIDILDHVAHS